MEKILSNKQGQKEILLGNEAIVRAGLETGVQFVSTYPGTPASEIGNTFSKIAQKAGVYFEFSTNEKAAMEAGVGASFSGLKTLVAMKSFGLNVAAEPLLPFCYTGAKGPIVIVVSDDPNCWSSAQSEENTRAYAYLAHIPTLEPSDPQECKNFIKLAFEISEKYKIPVLIRLTTRVSHQRGPVIFNKFKPAKTILGKFEKEPKRFVTMPPRVLEMKKELLEKIKQIQELAERSNINQIQNPNVKCQTKSKIQMSKLGILSSGISYLYVMEALEELRLNVPVLKLGFFYPLPEKKIKRFIKPLKKVLIVEELDPWLEKEISRLAKDVNCNLKIMGKELLSEVGELKPEQVISAIAEFARSVILRAKPEESQSIDPSPSAQGDACGVKLKIPRRSPQLCPGCPYWFVFGGIKKAVGKRKIVFGGDIGCYMLAGLAPHHIQDYLSCMGSSLGIAHGIRKSTKDKVIALIGDSTFFHSGIPGLINTVFNKSNPLIIVMDNRTTAMTGQQPHPGAPAAPDGIKIENIVRACGIKNCQVIDPVNQEKFVKTIKDFLNKKYVSVIIARRPCIFVNKK